MAEDYYFPTAAIKVQATDKISLGLLYDQPFGADSQYAPESNAFATVNTNTGVLEGTSVEVKTNSITALIGYQPNENWNVYAGPVYQSVKAKVSYVVQLIEARKFLAVMILTLKKVKLTVG